MGTLRMLTAGESHGEALVVILEGIPANLKISVEYIKNELKRRRIAEGRSERMKKERDEIKILSGLRFGKTIGSPIAIMIKNQEWKKWEKIMSPEENYEAEGSILYPRPGHADLAGIIKYNQSDIRNISERASARETAARVAAGAICKLFLKSFNINITSHIISIGRVSISKKEVSFEEADNIDYFSALRCVEEEAKKEMIKLIEYAKKTGDSLGGIFEIIMKGVPPGLGSYIQWDKRLDAAIASAIISIPGIKGVEIGLGFDSAIKFGSEIHDAIFYDEEKGYYRKTNNAGGIEGGISNGEEIRIKAAMKPIPTLKKPLPSVNILTKDKGKANYQRADICAVNSAAIIGENMLAFIISKYLLEKFGGDSMEETLRNYNSYCDNFASKTIKHLSH